MAAVFVDYAGTIEMPTVPDFPRRSELPFTVSQPRMPYLDEIAERAFSVPAASSISATPSTAAPSTLPRAEHGAMVTEELRLMRLTFHESVVVHTSRRSPSRAPHNGVATGVPSFLKVVSDTYFPSAMFAKVAMPIKGTATPPPGRLRFRDTPDVSRRGLRRRARPTSFVPLLRATARRSRAEPTDWTAA